MPIDGGAEVVELPIDGGGETKSLLAIIHQLSRARSQDEILTIVSHGVRSLLHADGASFVLREGDRCFYAEEDAVSPLWKGRLFPMSACVSGWCMINDRAVAIPDIYRDRRVPIDAYRPTFVKSLAMAPVRLDEPVAAIGAYWSERRQPRADEMECLQAIADAAALAVGNLQPRRAAPPGRRVRAEPSPVGEAHPPLPHAARIGHALRNVIDRIRHSGLRQGSPEPYAFAVLCVLIATLLRLLAQASGVQGILKSPTYFPAVLLAVLVGGRRAGILASVLGGLAAYVFFMPPNRLAPFSATDAINLLLYAGSCALIIVIVSGYKRTVRNLKAEDARHLTLAREQHHRVRNAVAVVDAIVKLSLRDEPERAESINRRISAGLAGIDMRDHSGEGPTRLHDLLTEELQPYDLSRFSLEGEDKARLPAENRSIVSLAIHELTTNALKYGALSVPDGRVTVTWRAVGDRRVIGWREADGPPVQPPKRRGYGSIMLRRLVEAAGGALAVDFKPDGVTAEITLPLEPDRGSRAKPSDAAA
jgi:two-component sensor histidine kinase